MASRTVGLDGSSCHTRASTEGQWQTWSWNLELKPQSGEQMTSVIFCAIAIELTLPKVRYRLCEYCRITVSVEFKDLTGIQVNMGRSMALRFGVRHVSRLGWSWQSWTLSLSEAESVSSYWKGSALLCLRILAFSCLNTLCLASYRPVGNVTTEILPLVSLVMVGFYNGRNQVAMLNY